MKKITIRFLLQGLLPMLLAVMFHIDAAGQGNSSRLIWDYQVGCIEYDYDGHDPKRGFVFDENIENAPCIRVCEGSKVNYSVEGNGISLVEWEITGGILNGTSGTNSQHASVTWGDAGGGSIRVTITYTDQSIKVFKPCVEIIPSPNAKFEIEGLDDKHVYCLNTLISFDNLSVANGGTEIIYYNWDFGDGNYSHEFEPTHSYEQPGIYEVTLTVVNQCNCTDKFSMQIEIIERPDVVISCPSVVCENGDKVTYTVNDDCGGKWQVEGGTIVGQTPNQIDVVWDQVDEEGFGYVYYLSSCGCPYRTTVKVPVVQTGGFIQGPDLACLNEQTHYSLPQWPTTDFQWTLNGNPQHPMLVYTDQRNEVYVNGLAPGVYTLRCDYTNTLLGCIGRAVKRITVLPSVTITGPEEFCSGTDVITYNNTDGVAVDWVLKKDNSIVAADNGMTFQHSFTEGGTYVLTATSSGGCDSEPYIITVIQTPIISGSITGEDVICPGVSYDYSYNNTDNNTVLDWEVDGGEIQGSHIGDEISVVFDSTGPYEVRVKKQSLTGDGCESDWLDINPTKLAFTPVIVNNDGLSTFCPSSETSFTVDLGGMVPDFIEWEIESQGNGPSNTNFGNIIGGVNGTDVSVSFNEISTYPTGVLRVTVYKCGVVEQDEFQIDLMEQPDLSLTAPAEICGNEPFDITLNSSTPLTSGSMVWTVNGQQYTRDIATDGLTLTGVTVDNINPNNLTADITVSVTHPNGCLYNLTSSTTITIMPRPVVQISPGNAFNVCPDENGVYPSVTIHANTNYSSTMPVGFQWFKNGTAMSGETDESLTIPAGTTSPVGTYYVVVTFTNASGCATKSSNVLVTADDCEEPPYCNLDFLPNLNIISNWTSCNRIDFEGFEDGNGVYPTEFNWQSSSPTNITGYDTDTDTPYFITDTPGEYIVEFEVTYMTPQGPCKTFTTTTVKKHYEPKFNYTISCDGENNYTVQLLDNSTLFEVLPGDLEYTYTTTSGTLSQVDTGATITNLGPGNHTFTLELQGAGQLACTYEVQLTIDPMVEPVLTYPEDGQLFCAEDVITLTIPGGYNQDYSYTWFFDGTSYQATSTETDINIDKNTSTLIYLEVTNQYGCKIQSDSINIDVSKAEFANGNFIPDQLSFCEGTTGGSIIYTPVGTPTPSGYIWMQGNDEVGTTTTPSFTPTESGSYWVVLLNEHGCRYGGMAANPVNVTVRKRPYVNIIGETNLCLGEETTLQGIVPDSNLERRWLLDGTPMAAPYGTWSDTTPLTIEVDQPAGSYTYTLEVRPVDDTLCGSEQDFTVTVYPAVNEPTLGYTVLTCEPYTVKINADGPSGNYNWSNGDSGQSITVYNGGVYQVTYTAPTGCSVSASITIPHVVDRYMWIFPTGCFEVCPLDEPQPYIIGPWATFEHYTWLVNGNAVQSGSYMPVPDLPVNQGGTYQLILENDGCVYESGIAYITPDPENCPFDPCRIEVGFKEEVIIEDGMYFIVGSLFNPNPTSITLSISSFNGFGVYTPATVSIPAGGTYNFNPLAFTPNPGFAGGDDHIVLQVVGQNCMTLIPVRFPSLNGINAVNSVPEVFAEPYLTLSPNPAATLVAISYDISMYYERADEIQIHDINGKLLSRLPLEHASGQLAVDVTGWQSATYIVSLHANGKRVLQQKLLVTP